MKKRFLWGVLTGIGSTLVLVSILCILGFGSLDILPFSNANSLGSSLSGTKNELANKGYSQEEIDEKVLKLQDYINEYYLEKVDVSNYADWMYKGLVASLEDPYSVYYTKEEYTKLQESTSGVYYGIGAYVSQNATTGVITITKPFVNGPAYEAGMLPGDILYKVEGEEVTGMDLTEVVSRMKGAEGTKVNLSIIREGKSDPIEVTVTRRRVEVPTIEYEMLDNKIGYIAVTGFEEVTAKQFRDALKDLDAKGQKGLIIDLRNNPGGLLTTVVDMLDRMLPQGMLVYTKDKNGEGTEYKSTSKEQFKKPLAVLINENSASASEVFAGAIKDYGTGTLVGTKSFGKGIVQTVFPLYDGTALKLTVSKYYSPKGHNIHGTGITPDIEVDLKEDLKKKVVIEKSEDNQLQEAIKVIKNKLSK